VFAPDGRYLGELKLNARLGTFAFGKDVMVAKLIDEDEVEYLSVWRMQ
jgi:hypothetical protein